ncbi:hypothetical protein Btru_039523 [Bulinus truncatus]|nr:hypothetical protein Btru_039523 [Bulinus truncatus]
MLKRAVLLLVTLLSYTSCNNNMRGGIKPYATTLDDPYVVYAVGAINKYYKTKGDNRTRTAVKVIDSSQQVVSGKIYRFTIQVTNGQWDENCKVEVLSQPWITYGAFQIHGDILCSNRTRNLS